MMTTKMIKVNEKSSFATRRTGWMNGLVLLIGSGIFFYLYYRFAGILTTNLIQTSGLITAILCVIILGWLGLKKRLNPDHLLIIIVIMGILLRFCYFFYTDYLERQHDVGGELAHQGYIDYIARTGNLPVSGEGQYYHPPVHHIMCAIVLKAGRMIGLDENYQWRLVQYLMLIVSCLSLFYAVRILKLVTQKERVIIFGTALFAFHPTNIILSPQLNNDNVMVFFYILAIYFLIKWFQKRTTWDMVFLAIAVSFAILTKKNAVMVLPVIGLAFLMAFFEKGNGARTERGKWFRQVAIFIGIAAPLSASHMVRNLLLFNQGLNYAPSPPFKMLSNDLSSFLTLPLKTMFQSPFVGFGNWDMMGINYPEYIIKNSLFGEWDFPGLEVAAMAALILCLINILILIFYFVRIRFKNFSKLDVLMLANLLIPFVFHIYFRIKYPYFCSEDFRYLAPILISAAYFQGKSTEHFLQNKNQLIRSSVLGLTLLFYASMMIFVVLIGM